MNYKTIVGLETHIELNTEQKMFCGCSAVYFGAKPNRHVCPVCLGLPGALPVPNYQAIEWTVLLGLALHCQINLQSFFERKHYFYPDLVKGYQISQYQQPLAQNGYLKVNGRKIRINRVHLEEDTGKLLHGEQFQDMGSYVDFNRSGVPLVEIVTEPEIESAKEAADYLKALQLTVQYLGVSDCDMEKGSMRCEPNISVLKALDWQEHHVLPNYKVEVKNINSFRYVKQAIEFETKRQILLLEQKQTPKQETRRYIESKKTTENMRTKEVAQDYRYFPEPDIPPIVFLPDQIESLKQKLNSLESPQKRQIDLEKNYQLNPTVAWQLTENKDLGDRYLKLVAFNKELDRPKLANLLINRKVDLTLPDSEIVKQAQSLLAKKTIAPEQLTQTVAQIIKNNPKAVADYQKGKQTALQFLLGQCLRILGRQIEVEDLKEILSKQLRLVK